MFFVIHNFQDKRQYLPFATWREAMANCQGVKDMILEAATVKEAANEYKRWLAARLANSPCHLPVGTC